MVPGRSSAAGLVEKACSVHCKAGRSWAVGPGEVLEVDPEMGSQLVAFGRHKEAAADVAEVAGMMIGGGA